MTGFGPIIEPHAADRPRREPSAPEIAEVAPKPADDDRKAEKAHLTPTARPLAIETERMAAFRNARAFPVKRPLAAEIERTAAETLDADDA